MVYREVARVLGRRDPYLEIRKKYNRLAQEFIPQLKTLLAKESDPLLSAFGIAILGNVIDLGHFTPSIWKMKSTIFPPASWQLTIIPICWKV